MQTGQASGRNDNPLIFVGTSVACGAMVLVLYARCETDIVATVALALAALNLGLLNLKHHNLIQRHNRVLSTLRLRARLTNETEQIGPG